MRVEITAYGPHLLIEHGATKVYGDNFYPVLRTIEEFPKFFGAHRDRTVYGIIAAVDIPQNLRVEVLKEGLCLARIHDGTFELLTPKNFKPRAFITPPEKNGKRKKSHLK